MQKRKKIIFISFTYVLILSISILLFTINTKVVKADENFNNLVGKDINAAPYAAYSWYTPDYKQGQYGNVPELDPDTKNAVGYEEGKEIDFNFNKVNGEEKSVINTFYYEVNDTNILNAETLTIGDTGVPFVDIAIIFAANINWDSENNLPILHLNPNVDNVLVNREKYLKPLQDKGIKIVLDILPNHQGIGFCNLTEQYAEFFAEQLVQCVDKFGLDGIDFDEEYAKYGMGGPKTYSEDKSLTRLATRLRERMPDKIISMFDYSVPYDVSVNSGELRDKNVFNFAYANYGGKSTASFVRHHWGHSEASYELNRGVPIYGTYYNDANSALTSGRGVLMFFAPHRQDNNDYFYYPERFSGVTQALYGEDCVWNNEYYPKDW